VSNDKGVTTTRRGNKRDLYAMHPMLSTWDDGKAELDLLVEKQEGLSQMVSIPLTKGQLYTIQALMRYSEKIERAELPGDVVTPGLLIKQDNDSDCFNACLATLTDIPLKEFPVITNEEYQAMDEETRRDVGVRQDNECLEVLKKNGWCWFHSYQMPPAGWSIGSGKSPRGDWNHAVLCHKGKPKFDPHKSDKYLDGPVLEYKCVYRIVPKE